MADNVPDMIWAKDLEKRYLFANRAFCRQLLNAADTDEPLGKTDMFFAQRERDRHPDDPQWHTFGELCQDSDLITLEHGTDPRYSRSSATSRAA
jgi:PAS domain-containing protein